MYISYVILNYHYRSVAMLLRPNSRLELSKENISSFDHFFASFVNPGAKGSLWPRAVLL